MSGECDKCGEHALECYCNKHFPNANDKFYFEGKFFETEEEFWCWVREFNSRQTTAEDFDNIFDIFKKDIWMNFCMMKFNLNNSQLKFILSEAMCFVIENMSILNNEKSVCQADEKINSEI